MRCNFKTVASCQERGMGGVTWNLLEIEKLWFKVSVLLRFTNREPTAAIRISGGDGHFFEIAQLETGVERVSSRSFCWARNASRTCA